MRGRCEPLRACTHNDDGNHTQPPYIDVLQYEQACLTYRQMSMRRAEWSHEHPRDHREHPRSLDLLHPGATARRCDRTAARPGVQSARRPHPGQAHGDDRRQQRGRDVRVRPHRTRRTVAADRVTPHEAPCRSRTRDPRATRYVGLLPAHNRPARHCRAGVPLLMPESRFRPMVESDWPEVASIYQAGIATGHATFEAVPPANWAAFITCKRSELSLVALDSADRVNGWVAAAPTSTRTAY